ncbi:MAG: flagellar motor protein MotB [Bacteriovoracia bacterium]
MRRKRIAQNISNHDGEFLWLVSFSDLLLLLFVFFVVLFTFAYQKMGQTDFETIAQTFNGKKKEKKETPIDHVQAKLMKWAVDKNLLDSVDVKRKDDSLILQIKEKILFSSGEYVLKDESTDLIGALSQALTLIPSPYRIGIEGHTDDIPFGNKRGPHIDNWELSTKRALEVLKALKLDDSVRKRAVVMGYGEMMPLVPNRDANGNPIADNQSKNRRVTIRVF